MQQSILSHGEEGWEGTNKGIWGLKHGDLANTWGCGVSKYSFQTNFKLVAIYVLPVNQITIYFFKLMVTGKYQFT